MSHLVTIGIPMFDNQSTVSQTISSLREQSFEDWTCVICDDSENSATITAARIAIGDDTRFQIFDNDERLGAAANWNKTLNQATSKYFKLLCADDVLESEALATEVAGLESDDSVVMTCGRRNIIDSRGKTIIKDRGLSGKMRKISGQRATNKFVTTGTNFFGEPSFVLFRTDALISAGGFNSEWSYLIDVISYLDVLQIGDLQFLDRNLGSFRISQTSWSANLSNQQKSETFRAIDYGSNLDKGSIDLFGRYRGKIRAFSNSQARRLVFKYLA